MVGMNDVFVINSTEEPRQMKLFEPNLSADEANQAGSE
jgi:hypothetical protein